MQLVQNAALISYLVDTRKNGVHAARKRGDLTGAPPKRPNIVVNLERDFRGRQNAHHSRATGLVATCMVGDAAGAEEHGRSLG